MPSKTMNPKSLANLRPEMGRKFTAVDGANPAPSGRKNAGLSLIEQVNRMQGWKREKLQKIVDDPDSPVLEVKAAMRWLNMEPGEFDRICDYTNHKALQKSETIVTTKHQRNVYIDDHAAAGN